MQYVINRPRNHNTGDPHVPIGPPVQHEPYNHQKCKNNRIPLRMVSFKNTTPQGRRHGNLHFSKSFPESFPEILRFCIIVLYGAFFKHHFQQNHRKSQAISMQFFMFSSFLLCCFFTRMILTKKGAASETSLWEVSQFYSPHYIWRVILLRSYIMLRIVVFGCAEFGE